MNNQELFQNPKGGDPMNSELIQTKHSLVEKELLSFFRGVQKRLISSETMSLYSHLPKRFYNFRFKLKKELSGREALCLALIVNHLDPYIKYNLILELEELCYKFKYEGIWCKVNTIIQLSEDVDKLFYILKIENISSRELFGNYLNQIQKVLEQRILLISPKTKVKKPQRKRGYNDHGSQRPSHKWLPKKIQNSPNPIREDRRGINLEIRGHQLEEKIKKPESPSNILPQKGEKVNEKSTTSPSSGNDRRKDSAS